MQDDSGPSAFHNRMILSMFYIPHRKGATVPTHTHPDPSPHHLTPPTHTPSWLWSFCPSSPPLWQPGWLLGPGGAQGFHGGCPVGLALEGWPTVPYWLQCHFLLLRVTHGSHLLLLGWEGSTSPRARVCLPEPRRSALGLARSSAAARPPHRARFLDLAASRGPELRPILWGTGACEAFWALCPAVQTRPEAGTGLCGSPQGSRLW